MIEKIIRRINRSINDFCVIIRDFFQGSIAGSYLCPRFLRYIIYRIFGNRIHSFRINPRCFIGGNKLTVGKRVFINYNNFFDLTDSIVIGNDVCIAMNGTFITSTHKISNSNRRAGEGISAPIVIEDGCWIGGGVTIMPGVTVKSGCIVNTGAVVTKDCEPNSLYAGIPAKKIRDL